MFHRGGSLAGVSEEERHLPGFSILGGVGDERTPADHLAAHHIVHCAARYVRSLFRQDLVIVAVKWRTAAADPISLTGRLGDQLSKRTIISALCRRPVQPIFLARAADDALGKNPDAGAGSVLLRVFVLSVNIGKARLYGIEFVAPDASIENFQAAGRRIKPPGRILADTGDWKREFHSTDHHERLALAVHSNLMLGVV